MRKRTPNLSRGKVVLAVAVVLIAAIALLGRHYTKMPDTRAEVDDRMDQDILAYEQWDDHHIIVFALDTSGRIYIDTIHRDWMTMGLPWIPRLQWSGMWSYVDATTDPAGVGYGWGNWGTAFFGQVNDPEITSIRCQMETYLLVQPVIAPGYAIKVLPGEDPPATCDFLDANGSLVWIATVIKSVV
jgi:hypothetical protein